MVGACLRLESREGKERSVVTLTENLLLVRLCARLLTRVSHVQIAELDCGLRGRWQSYIGGGGGMIYLSFDSERRLSVGEVMCSKPCCPMSLWAKQLPCLSCFSLLKVGMQCGTPS